VGGVAVDIPAIDPVLAKLNEVFSGTSLHREKMEVWSLLRDLADEYIAGNVEEYELSTYVAEIAQTICAQIAGSGKACSPERLAEELLAAVRRYALTRSGTRAFSIREKLKTAREKAREKRERLSVL